MTTARVREAEAPDPARTSIRWVRIIPVALIMYTIAFIDRTNISLALPHISRDLHLDPQQAGTVAGIFFWGYLVLQIPGGHLAKHWSAKKFISILLVAWALFAVGCGLARTYHELLLLRLLLGVAESGVYPATLILLSHWFSRFGTGSCKCALAPVFTRRRHPVVTFFRLDAGPLELARHAGSRRFFALPVASDLAGLYSGSSE